MKKIGIFYGSSSGNTQSIAKKIAEHLNIDTKDICDVAKTPIEKMLEYDHLLLGSSTWGVGDIQDDWNLGELESLDLSNKKIAVFGTGDSSSYSDTFCDAIGLLAGATQKAGGALTGNKVDASDYSFDSSISEKEGYFCGLAIDEDNESEKTDMRIKEWVKQLNEDFKA